MEDGDGDSGIIDTMTTPANDGSKSTDHDESISEVVLPNSGSDQNDEGRSENFVSSIVEHGTDRSQNSAANIIYKGFKKRILAQAQESQPAILRNEFLESRYQTSNVSLRVIRDKRSDTKRGKITEYAQYLGLQPAAKYKCLKCHSAATFCSISMLKQHQRNCTFAMTPMQAVLGNSESTSTPIATNFRITRKVYLCSACGTYFENWNLFLHMREIHKRHICLFCLGMFGQAERLSYHLWSKHSVPETEFQSVEDFYNAFKGSCYLICCNCENIFSETDDFFNHFCSTMQNQSAADVCSVCRQTNSHTSSCTVSSDTRLSVTDTVVQPLNSISTIRTHGQLTGGGGKNICKKIIRDNRLKLFDCSQMSATCHQKSNESRKPDENTTSISRYRNTSELELLSSANPDLELSIDSSRDTVAETIMEVSRYVEKSDTDDDTSVNIEVYQEGGQANELRRDTSKQSYIDNVTETIMEVSRLNENSDIVTDNNMEHADVRSSRLRENVESIDVQDTNSLNVNVELDDRLNSASSVENELDEGDVRYSEVPLHIDAQNCSESQTSDSSATSPTVHSLFSPRRDLQSLDVNTILHQSEQLADEDDLEEQLGGEEIKDSTGKGGQDHPAESQTRVLFNAVAPTDRSLVIKICTNRVSQLSVTTSNIAVNNSENHDMSRESEENNNGEGSTSEEKTPNLAERERDSVDGQQLISQETQNKKSVIADATVDVQEIVEPVKEGEDENVNSGSDKLQDGHGEEKADLEANRIVLAGEEVPSIDLNVEGTMESIEIEGLLKHCIDAASPTCVYCNHARQIAVNGKQLGLHMLAEHRFLPQHPAIIIQREQFTARIKKALQGIETYFFNLDSYNTAGGTYHVPDSRTYECFHCRFHSTVHKELYLHNRKMHQKTILICIMCKSTFYSYSELLCHLCPGVYSPNINVKYRCCLCPTNNLPSAFRLMVHLRKRHHVCDVCLEATGNQQRLSNHVWKHKLHHLCYRCGIAYRNKPDITKHLFWKHGTESVLCKKCLQKKWPHVYHFCIPPTAFVCEECSSSFSRAVALKVHKRLHSGDLPYSCENCSAQFISKKLLLKHHQGNHKDQSNVLIDATNEPEQQSQANTDSAKDGTMSNENTTDSPDGNKDSKEGVKKVVDVYDLPPLNLSSDSDSDSDTGNKEPARDVIEETSVPGKLIEAPEQRLTDSKYAVPVKPALVEPDKVPLEIYSIEDEKKEEVQIIDGIWDNFKSYTASLEMKESHTDMIKDSEKEIENLRNIVLADHDYCLCTFEKEDLKLSLNEEDTSRIASHTTLGSEHDYIGKTIKSPEATSVNLQNAIYENEAVKKKSKTPRAKKQSGSPSSSDTSSDSESSNCSCGTNCSCSSSSSGSSSSSSSSSDSDSSVSDGSPRKQSNHKDRRKIKDATKRNKSDSIEADAKVATLQIENGLNLSDACNVEPISETVLKESDLDTEETNTDEDFYDEHPQQLANKLLAEKRNQLMLLAAVAPVSTELPMAAPLNNGALGTDQSLQQRTLSPNTIVPNTSEQPKKKVKTKKRKKSDKEKQRMTTPIVESIKLNIPKSFYQTKPGFASSSPAFITVVPSRSSTPNPLIPLAEVSTGKESQVRNSSNRSAVGSGSEADNKRLSKRKRVPKRFYGDSSDEESEIQQPVLKWKKTEPPSFMTSEVTNAHSLQPAVPANLLPYGGVPTHTEASATTMSNSESEAQAGTSTDSSESDADHANQQQLPQQETRRQVPAHHPAQHYPHNTDHNATVLERSDNLYCYCQCPYDEVSEMIACDGDDCHIEWFHFECVGIMVPPKGKWYCPDCRKKQGILNSSEDFFD